VRIERVDPAEARPVAQPDWFPGGDVRTQPLSDPESGDDVEILAVFFPAGARTRPHTHPTDQVLQVVEGEGIVATEDERRLIRAGDFVVVPAGIWHWHGATDRSSLCHLSIKQPGQTDWTAPWRDWETYMEGAE
jgi:quercetin dioxygenase-like cupin family protein